MTGEEGVILKQLNDTNNRIEAFQTLFNTYYERVFEVAYYMTKDRHLAQDVLQEAFMKAYNHLDDLQDIKKTGSWLSVVTTNTAIDLLRKRKRWNGIPTDDVILLNQMQPYEENNSEVENQVIQTLLIEQIQAQFGNLSPEHRQAILLKYYHGLKDDEIAKLTGSTAGTIKSRLHRAKKKIHSLLLAHEQRGKRESVGESN